MAASCRTTPCAPFVGRARGQGAVLWDCPEWEAARATWLPWMHDAADELLQLGPPEQWLACLRRVGLMPLHLSAGMEQARMDESLYRLYGMYLAVLAARMTACWGNPAGLGMRSSRATCSHCQATCICGRICVGPWPGMCSECSPAYDWAYRPPGWRQAREFVLDLVGEVSWAELALDYEAFVGRALPASLDHHLRWESKRRSCAMLPALWRNTWRQANCSVGSRWTATAAAQRHR